LPSGRVAAGRRGDEQVGGRSARLHHEEVTVPRHGKQYLEAAKKVDRTKLYTPAEAIKLLREVSYAKFDPTVEVHIRTGVDPRHADQMVRGLAVLPAGTGKRVRVLAFAQGEKAKEAEEAGADYVGGQELVQKIEGGWLEFDVAVATPDMMGMVGRLGKILGRRGLMPNPKAGTISFDIGKVIKEVKAGRVEFRVDKTAVIHVPIGKLSFTDEQLMTNLAALLEAVVRAKPSGAKGQYIRSIAIASSMSPGIALDLQSALSMAAA
jgi:large subunit ribosomal protein L1